MNHSCPICDAELVEVYTDYLEHILCEQGERCPNKCYHYDFAYGGTCVTIGEVETIWSYNESEEEYKIRHAKMEEIIEQFKDYRAWTPII